jgi:hypothetical protein
MLVIFVLLFCVFSILCSPRFCIVLYIVSPFVYTCLNMLVIFVLLFCVFSILCSLRFCIVLCIVSPFVYTCLFPIFVQIYRPLPPGGNPLAVNKYRISSYILRSHTENVKRSDTGGLRCPDRPHVSVLHRPSCVCVCVCVCVRGDSSKVWSWCAGWPDVNHI